MHGSHEFLQSFALVLTVAGLAAWVAQRLGISSVAGYLLAGVLLSPHTLHLPWMDHSQESLQALSEFGLVIIMFNLGLELNISRLKALGVPLMICAVIFATLMFNAGTALGGLMGLSQGGAMHLAAMLMISSSAIVSKILADMNATHTRAGQTALGLLVLEDVAAIVMIAFLTSLIQYKSAQFDVLAQSLGSVGAFTVVSLVLAFLIMPRLISQWTRTAGHDVQTVLVIASVLVMAWIANVAGFSLALGAILLGAVVGSTRFNTRVEHLIEGMRHIFASVFFVVIGMMFDYQLFLKYWHQVLLLTVAVFALRPLAYTIALTLVGRKTRESLQTSMTLTPIGEFSFIIAQMGVFAGMLPESFFSVTVGFAVLTAIIAPKFITQSPKWSQSLARCEPAFLVKLQDRYHSWLQKLGIQASANILWKLTSTRLVQLTVQALFILGMGVIFKLIRPQMLTLLPSLNWFPQDTATVAVALFAILLIIPISAFWRNYDALSMIFAEALTLRARSKKSKRQALEWLIKGLPLVVIFSWVVWKEPFDVPAIYTLSIFTLAMIGSSLLNQRHLIRLHTTLENDLRHAMANPSSSHEDRLASANRVLNPHEDWNLCLREVTVPADSDHLGSTLEQLDLRNRLGCSIVSIDRHGYVLPKIEAQTQIFPEDRLLILGHEEPLANAEKFLTQTTTTDDAPTSNMFEDIVMEPVVLMQDSVAVGKSLRDLQLTNRYQILVASLRRHQEQFDSIDPFMPLQAGDELLVLGPPEQIARLQDDFLATSKCNNL